MTTEDPSLSFSGHLNLSDLLEGRLFNERTLLIDDEIEAYTAGLLTKMFQILATKPAPITLLITSPGGLVDAGNTIIRAIRYAQSKDAQVIGEVRGFAHSMAALILQACDVRFAASEDTIMVHGLSGASMGDVRDTETELELTKRLVTIHAEFLAKRNTSEDEEFHKETYWRRVLKDAHPTYFFGQEALTHGLIDGVLD